MAKGRNQAGSEVSRTPAFPRAFALPPSHPPTSPVSVALHALVCRNIDLFSSSSSSLCEFSSLDAEYVVEVELRCDVTVNGSSWCITFVSYGLRY